jgi:hypothetical protein
MGVFSEQAQSPEVTYRFIDRSVTIGYACFLCDGKIELIK